MVDGLVGEEDAVLDEHGSAPQDEGGEEVDVDGIPGAVQLPAGGMGCARAGAEMVLWCPLPWPEPSPGVTAGEGHKALEKFSCSKIRKDGAVLCWGLLRGKGNIPETSGEPKSAARGDLQTQNSTGPPKGLVCTTREGQRCRSSPAFPVVLSAGMDPGCSGRGQAEGSHPCWGFIPCPSSPRGWSSSQPYLKQEKMPMARSSAASDVE